MAAPRDPREELNGILWALRDGAPWKELPDRYLAAPDMPYQWVKAGVFRRVVEELATDLQERGGLDIREAFVDGSFVPRQKRDAAVGRTKAAGSWQLRMLPVFLPPPVLQVLRRMR